jgi:hypothetical protein
MIKYLHVPTCRTRGCSQGTPILPPRPSLSIPLLHPPFASILHPFSFLSPITWNVLTFPLRMHSPTQVCHLFRCELLIHHGGGGTFGAGVRCLRLPASFLLLPHSHCRAYRLAGSLLLALPPYSLPGLPAWPACLASLFSVHCLRAGKPTIVCPCMADQPFWGRTAHQLGIGPKPIAFKVRSTYSQPRFVPCLPFCV